MKLILDAGFLVEACAGDGVERRLWSEGLDGYELLISPEIFAAAERSLRLERYHLAPERVRAILAAILDRCVVVRPKARPRGAPPAGADRALAELVEETRADAILTTDSRLLDAGRLGVARVVGPDAFSGGRPV